MTFIGSASVEQGIARPVAWSNFNFTSDDIRKWMNVAKAIQESPDNCLSRQIGCIIVDPEANALVSAGHNGPPDDVPRADSEDYLHSVVWPQLTEQEKKYAARRWSDYEDRDLFLQNYAGCGECPRRMVGCPSGQRLEICPCEHGEKNAIVRAHRSVRGMWMFCWCSVPCIDCTKLIINSKLSTVVALDHIPEDKVGKHDYSPYSSRWLYRNSKTNLLLVTKEWLASA